MGNKNCGPIETFFRGYRFRSRLEARWAVFFESLGIKWEFEIEGYNFGKYGCYLPDFWLPESQFWVEIKPKCPNDGEIEKMEQLHLATTFPVCLFFPNPWNCNVYIVCTDTDDGGGGIYSHLVEYAGFIDILRIDDDNKLHVLSHDTKTDRTLLNSDFSKARCVHSFWDAVRGKMWSEDSEERLKHACNKAKQARFEHGEIPA